MTPSLLSFAAGVLTVSSPCVLPVLLLLFARQGSGRLFAGLGGVRHARRANCGNSCA